MNEKTDQDSSLVARDKRFIWHPDTQMLTAPPPIPIVSGKGASLLDEDGNEYIDGVSSWWVNIHGHSHPYIAQKLALQAQTLEHCIFAGLTHPPAVDLAERLLDILPGNRDKPETLQRKIFYSDNGSTAVEVALKMAIQYWDNQQIAKKRFLAFRHGYHGDTFGAMSVSSRSVFTHSFEAFLFEVDYIDIPAVEGKEDDYFNAPDKLATGIPSDKYYEAVREKISGGQYAAFIFEPLILGAGGMKMYAPNALEKLIEICREQNMLIIADEVMTGFGRTGKHFAMNYLSVHPDIICMSKGLTGGTMALGVTSCVESVYNAFLSTDKLKMFLHGHSFTANPLACTAALASLDLFLKEECKHNILRIIEQHAIFRHQIKDRPGIKNVRQTGTIVAFEIITKETDSYMNSARDYISNFFLEHYIVLRPLGNTIYILPPYCTTNEQLKKIYEVIIRLLDEIERQ